jgi:cytochrome c-type biogenesis protein CcmH
MKRPLALALLSTLLALPVVVMAQEHGQGEVVAAAADPQVEATARALEGRIKAPCCWNQTLDIHGSPVSQELKAEIRTRLSRGETSAEIEASFVDRYGERILAVPPDSPLGNFALFALLLAVVAGGGVFFLGRKWKGRSSDDASGDDDGGDGGGGDDDVDEYDARLDAELEEA